MVEQYSGTSYQYADTTRIQSQGGTGRVHRHRPHDEGGSFAQVLADSSAGSDSSSGTSTSLAGGGTLSQQMSSLLLQLQDLMGARTASGGQDGGADPSATGDPLLQALQNTASGAAGTLSKADFATAFASDTDTASTAGTAASASSGTTSSNADTVFATLDANGDGSIDQTEAQQALRPHHRHGGHHGAGGSGTVTGTADAGSTTASTIGGAADSSNGAFPGAPPDMATLLAQLQAQMNSAMSV